MFGKERPLPSEALGLTDREKLFDRISDTRFHALIADEQTLVHAVELSSNTFGEFQFITISRPSGTGRLYATFWGNGYHDYRERWITQEWQWYETTQRGDQVLDKSEVETLLRERTEEIARYAEQSVQTERGRLFDIIADLTDDDGALAEMEDMDDLLDE